MVNMAVSLGFCDWEVSREFPMQDVTGNLVNETILD